jgi:hypothetical protein
MTDYNKWFLSRMIGLVIVVWTIATLISCNTTVPYEDGNNMRILNVSVYQQPYPWAKYEIGYFTPTISGTIIFIDSIGRFNVGDTVRVIKVTK